MLKPGRIGLAIVLSFIVVGGVIELLPPFKQCICERQYEDAYYAIQENQSYGLVAFATRHIDCFGACLAEFHEPIIAVFTILIAIFTLALWLSTASLVIGADEDSRRKLRAYVCIDDVSVFSATEDGRRAMVPGYSKDAPPLVGFHLGWEASFKNFGDTPAHDLRVQSDCELVDWPIKETYVPNIKVTEDASIEVIGPTADRSVFGRTKESLTTDIFIGLQDGTKAYVLYGVIEYNDIFGKQHTTNFRYYCGGPTGADDVAAHKNGNQAT